MLIKVRKFKEGNRPLGGIMLVVTMPVILEAANREKGRFDRKPWNSTGGQANGNDLTWGQIHP